MSGLDLMVNGPLTVLKPYFVSELGDPQLERIHAKHIAGFLRGDGLIGERIGSMRRAFRIAADRAKLPKRLHQHDVRHRRVTTWLAEGRDVVLVKEAM